MSQDGVVGGGDSGLPITALPKTALQAIYHAVTGKTENLSKVLEGSVVIRQGDFDRLYGMIVNQICLHPKMFDPTVTVVVKQANEKVVTYSSWERFKALRVNNHDITSEITLKVEFVIKLPETQTPQRCVVNVNLDSALPVIKSHRGEDDSGDAFGYFFVFTRKWRTAKISIDFVDFLVAKSFVNLVEEWSSTLESAPTRAADTFLLKNMAALRGALNQIGRIGIGAFLAGYAILSGASFNLVRLTIGVSIAFILWAVLEIVQISITRRLMKRVSSNVIPTVFLLTDKDRETYADIPRKINSPVITIANVVFSVIGAVILNVMASYMYAYLAS